MEENLMSTEMIAERYKDLDTWSLAQTIEAITESNGRAVEAVKKALPHITRAAEGIETCLKANGRLIYIGAGTSGRLAMQDAAELAPTFGFENFLVLLAGGNNANKQAAEDAEDDEEAAIKEIEEARVQKYDAVIGIAASGKTPYTVAGIKKAREVGAFTVGIANNPDTLLLLASEVGIFLETGPEVLAGSTRLAAGTAQKIVLNALSTSVLVKLGGAYQNLMVGMRPKNDKLRKRAVSMVSLAANVHEAQAREILEQTDWRIREAIVMLKAGVDVKTAETELLHQGQRVRDAIQTIEARD
jgi:N-acetylmuramic acid 6-phosphate etherase